jgi:mRNA interferase HicA
VRYREVERKLNRLGCVELKSGSGSHRKWINPGTGRGAPIPDWGSKDLKMGTLRAVIKQLGLEWNDFTKA